MRILFTVTCFSLVSTILASPTSGNGLRKFRHEEEISEEDFTKDVEDYIVNFMLYNRDHPDKFNLIQVENKLSISRSSFDPNKDTKILIHGWKNGYESNVDVVLKDAYLKRYDANIIVVDWSTQSHFNYISSRMDVGKVADVVAQLIDLLVTNFNMKLSKVHMLGHSLGAHVAGIAGLKLRTGKVSRVTGLDPAAPMFTVHESGRIRPDSAEFVDVIHTCGDLLGFKAPLGQVDFYPNGGTYKQPGCGFDLKGKCSHSRSYIYYSESINDDNFYAVSCESWNSFKEKNCTLPPIIMGEFAPTWARGKYYLKTNEEAPFGQGPDAYLQSSDFI